MVVVGGLAALGGIGYLLLSGDKKKKTSKSLSGTEDTQEENKNSQGQVEAIELS